MPRTRARTAALEQLYDELLGLLEKHLWRTPADTVPVASFLQVHAADLKSIVAARDGSSLLWQAVYAGHADVVLALLDAGAVLNEDEYGLYHYLLEHKSIYDLNGAVLDDAGIARRLRIIHDTHEVRPQRSEFMSYATSSCVWRDRLECLRVMVEIDPHARGCAVDCHESLLHIAVTYRKPRIVRFLLESGWSLTGVDLDDDDRSPLGSCLLPLSDYPSDAVCDTLDALLHDVEDAPLIFRNSGLCDAAVRRSTGDCIMPAPEISRMHMFICAAVHAYSSLPRRVLLGSCRVAAVFHRSPSKSLLLTLDEHVHTSIGDPIYLRDSLRVASSFNSAARYAAAIDVLRIVEATVKADPERWRYAKCMDVLHTSGEPAVTGASLTPRCWAWMRRLHAVNARLYMLRREAAWRSGTVMRTM